MWGFSDKSQVGVCCPQFRNGTVGWTNLYENDTLGYTKFYVRNFMSLRFLDKNCQIFVFSRPKSPKFRVLKRNYKNLIGRGPKFAENTIHYSVKMKIQNDNAF